MNKNMQSISKYSVHCFFCSWEIEKTAISCLKHDETNSRKIYESVNKWWKNNERNKTSENEIKGAKEEDGIKLNYTILGNIWSC